MRCFVDKSMVTAEKEIREARRANDKYLVTACEFYRNRQQIVSRNPEHIAKFPAMHEAFMLHMHAGNNGGYKWLVEAMLMTDASDEEIANEFCPLHGKETIATYRKVYFDIDHYRHRKANVLCSILAQSLTKTHSETDCDFTWKVIAYTQGFEAFREFVAFRAGGLLPETMRSWFRDISSFRRSYGEFNLTSSLRNMYRQEAIAVLDHADKHWSMQNSAASKMMSGGGSLTEETGRSVLESLEQALMDPNIPSMVKEARAFYEPGISPHFKPNSDLAKRVLHK